VATALSQLRFTNRFTAELPADPHDAPGSRQVHGAAYSRVTPATVSRPSVIAHSAEVVELLGLPPDIVDDPAFAEVVTGNRLLPGMDPHAVCYGGHQFGQWAGQLGDGRAIALGEVVDGAGRHWTLQLKGAGPTPYSRRADGLAVLRSSVREFLCSEAMHHLGIPTTRALSLALTGESVVRDMFYDGRPAPEPGAIVTRVAPSFVRFGNFEIFASRNDLDLLRRLADHVIAADFPHLVDGPVNGPDTYAAFFDEVVERTAALMVHWMRVGFVHGVMNTDNLSITGLTIDYGPYGWLEDYDPSWTPNTTDAAGRRYRYGQQPQVAHWNLVQLANALYPLIGRAEPLQAAIDRYPEHYRDGWHRAMAAKLGLARFDVEAGDGELTDELFDLLASVETDMTVFFRRLADVALPADVSAGPPPELADAYYRPDQLDRDVLARLGAWLERYAARVERDGVPPAERRRRMHAVNPLVVLRNYLAQLAIDRATAGDPGGITELLDALRRPYDERDEAAPFVAKRPEWARHRAGCSMLSCSS
jgi:serine/tyrosine/threonine adenylyltransferase